MLCTILFIVCLKLVHDYGLPVILLISFLYGIFTVFTEVAEPVVIKNLIQGQKSTTSLSTYEIRTRAVQLLYALCGYLIAVDGFLPYYLLLMLSFLALFFLSFIKIKEPRTDHKYEIRYNN